MMLIGLLFFFSFSTHIIFSCIYIYIYVFILAWMNDYTINDLVFANYYLCLFLFCSHVDLLICSVLIFFLVYIYVFISFLFLFFFLSVANQRLLLRPCSSSSMSPLSGDSLIELQKKQHELYGSELLPLSSFFPTPSHSYISSDYTMCWMLN